MPRERNVPTLVKEKLTRRWRRGQAGGWDGGEEWMGRGWWSVGTERGQLINCKLARLKEK